MLGCSYSVSFALDWNFIGRIQTVVVFMTAKIDGALRMLFWIYRVIILRSRLVGTFPLVFWDYSGLFPLFCPIFSSHSPLYLLKRWYKIPGNIPWISSEIDSKQLLRWIVERTFSWIENYRRMAINYEWCSEYAEAMVYLTLCYILIKKYTYKFKITSQNTTYIF